MLLTVLLLPSFFFTSIRFKTIAFTSTISATIMTTVTITTMSISVAVTITLPSIFVRLIPLLLSLSHLQVVVL